MKQTYPAVLPSTTAPITVAKIGLEREKRFLLLGRNRVSKVEPVGIVGSKKLTLSIPYPIGAWVSPKHD